MAGVYEPGRESMPGVYEILGETKKVSTKLDQYNQYKVIRQQFAFSGKYGFQQFAFSGKITRKQFAFS